MSAPSEPEKYSIDEMMDRLKSRPTESSAQDGELVTRPDGSQAIRVRKRKRRSHQPHKEELKSNRRARMIQVSGGLILLLLGIFAAGVAIVYANSAGFREALTKKITANSGASVDLQQFRMNPTSANANQLILKWPDGNALRDLTLRGIRAEVFPSSFLGKSMNGEEVVGSEATLTVRIPQSGKPRSEAAIAETSPSIRFKRYAVPKFNAAIGDSSAPFISMKNSEASFHPFNSNGRAQLLLNRGEISIVGWPKIRMDRSHIEFRDSHVDVVGMRLLHETDARGLFEISGTITPYEPDRASTLGVHLESYLLSGLVGAELGHLFSGRVDTVESTKSNYLSFSPGENPDASLVISFRGSLTSSFELHSFPFLSMLARTLDDKWFEKPLFESDVSGTLRRSDGVVSLADLSFSNKDRMALRGAVTMAENRRLVGSLELGVAEGMISSSKNKRLDSMFGPTNEGLRWVTLKVGGSAAQPTDNFRELYEAAATQVKPVDTGEIPTFEELTRPK